MSVCRICTNAQCVSQWAGGSGGSGGPQELDPGLEVDSCGCGCSNSLVLTGAAARDAPTACCCSSWTPRWAWFSHPLWDVTHLSTHAADTTRPHRVAAQSLWFFFSFYSGSTSPIAVALRHARCVCVCVCVNTAGDCVTLFDKWFLFQTL